MRVATYTQPTAVTRGSLAALAVLVLTILLGTTVLASLATQFAPAFVGYTTHLWLGLYALAFLGLMFGQGINWVSWLVRYRILLVVLLVGAVCSVAWSIDSRVSAERTVHLVGTSLIGIYLGFTVPLLTLLRVLAVVLGAVFVASVPAALVLPELGTTEYEGRLVWRGVMNSKNDLGFWAASGVLLYLTLSDSTRALLPKLLCYAFAGLCLALLAFSQSATSLVAMLVAGALSLYLFIAIRFRLGFVRMAVVAVLFTALVALAVVNVGTAELVGRADDLTGRAEVWRQTWNLIMERPLGGYGYGSLWFPNDATIWIQESLTDFSWVVYHAHNGFLQVASEIGLPLSIVALLMVVQQLIEIFYCQYQRQQAGVLFVLAFVVAYLIGNFSEARFLVTRELYWVLFIALPISMLRQINVVSTESIEESHSLDATWGVGTGGASPAASPSRALVPGTAVAPAMAVAANHWSDWDDDVLDLTASALAEGIVDIDLGDPAPSDEADRDAAGSAGPVASEGGHPIPADVSPFGPLADAAGANDAVSDIVPDEGDRYDKTIDPGDRFDASDDGSDDGWLDLPFDSAGHRG